LEKKKLHTADYVLQTMMMKNLLILMFLYLQLSIGAFHFGSFFSRKTSSLHTEKQNNVNVIPEETESAHLQLKNIDVVENSLQQSTGVDCRKYLELFEYFQSEDNQILASTTNGKQALDHFFKHLYGFNASENSTISLRQVINRQFSSSP
jgi:hypothetical protein